ncbi:Pimeloyl-ACP methyl ester carboxylesterase [Nonomuraea solani]|uniref:Pimeloyl-ACP methyl ester carboxylesterase n=1 Tax=Nonomuraea solani TaxID=1144553 RepID=A0A1H6F1K7_9ACTN|nr:alpha/beta hydrolase [Nonomuraea solani]SEH04010.1 Pimeloyl-ACP methyl ester carboxylesterase [Nonomuraea solani]
MSAYPYDNPYEGLSGTINIRAVRAAGFRERQLDTGTLRINYVVGPDNGPPLVLLPAQMGIWESYQRVLVPLSRRLRVYAVDMRGHGKSSWTPGAYSWRHLGADMTAFLSEIVRSPAVISGNSSGGLLALWCAANLPDQVAGAILEDAPVFSAEMPRFRDRDRFVFGGLKHLAETLGDPHHRDLADYFRGLTLPVSATREKRVPDWFISFLSRRVQAFQSRHPSEPVDIRYFPLKLRLLLKCLSMYDPDFARAFVDGRFYEGLDHADALAHVSCPLLVLHADWRRVPGHGLIGAMDDEDAARIGELVPHSRYRKIHANHVIHMFEPRQYVEAVDTFLKQDVLGEFARPAGPA